jgi:hypothetical protein
VDVTRVDTAKRLLIDLLAAQSAGTLAGVQLAYSEPANLQREAIFGGTRMTWSHDIGENLQWDMRLETAQFHLIIRVSGSAQTTDDNDQRCIDLGQVVQDVCQANPKPLGANSWWTPVAGELLVFRTDEESISSLALTVEVRSYV